MKKRTARQRVTAIIAPDLRRYIEDEPASGFIEWCEHTAETMAKANTPEERAYARIMRSMVVAIIESANTADKRDGCPPGVVALFVPRAAMTGAVCGLISVFKEDTPVSDLRDIIIRELDVVLELMAPGKTIGEGR